MTPIPEFDSYRIDLGTQEVRGPRGVIKPRIDSRGRVWVRLYRDGVQHNCKLGRLMLLTFVGPPEPGQVCRHLDDVPSNNALENLCWGTQSENMHDKVANGLHWASNKTHCKWGHPFDEANTRYTTDGRRRCRQCAMLRAREKRAQAVRP